MDLNNHVRNSALWAAYGDAIGFISELATLSNLKQRAGVTHLVKTVPWKRRIGGKFGVNIALPAGCYSDDTQLRLSVSRAIGAKGFFDVEAFAKVELPIWTNYALGAGRGSKCAALSITKRNATWNNNFFESDDLQYVNMGGNGAAMRIQPHVWSFPLSGDKLILIRDIIRDSITTHGHMRGILGAVFHGLSLLQALQNNVVPSPNDWVECLKDLMLVSQVIKDDDQLSYVWLPLWEKTSKKILKDECIQVIDEIYFDINSIQHFLIDKELSQYHDIVSAVGGFKAENKGSAVKTAILANVLAYLASGNPEKAVVNSANEIGSDTDTIATMAGAIAGAVADDAPSGKLLDYEYIVSEADRMYKIGQGMGSETFSYPDLLSWTPPSNQLDVLQTTPNGMRFSALGEVTPFGNEVAGENNTTMWQWFKSSYGQSFLIKHRPIPKHSDNTNDTFIGKYRNNIIQKDNNKEEIKSNRVNKDNNSPNKDNNILYNVEIKPPNTIDEALDAVIKARFNSNVLGEMFLKILDSDDNVERCIAFAALVAKARLVRRGK